MEQLLHRTRDVNGLHSRGPDEARLELPKEQVDSRIVAPLIRKMSRCDKEDTFLTPVVLCASRVRTSAGIQRRCNTTAVPTASRTQ